MSFALAGLLSFHVEFVCIMQKKGSCLNNIAALLLLAALLVAVSGCAGEPPAGPAGDLAGREARQNDISLGKTGVTNSPSTAAQSPPAPNGAAAQPRSGETSEASPPPGQTKPDTSLKLLPARVTRVVDGDTVYVRLENGREEKVRFIGVDTPESTREVEPYGKKAAAYTKSRLDGKKVYLELDVGERDKYGRLLAYVWLEPPKGDSETELRAKMFNAKLLLAGMARVMTVPPNVKYADLFVKFQREAREAGKGLWSGSTGKNERKPK